MFPHVLQGKLSSFRWAGANSLALFNEEPSPLTILEQFTRRSKLPAFLWRALPEAPLPFVCLDETPLAPFVCKDYLCAPSQPIETLSATIGALPPL